MIRSLTFSFSHIKFENVLILAFLVSCAKETCPFQISNDDYLSCTALHSWFYLDLASEHFATKLLFNFGRSFALTLQSYQINDALRVL